MQFPSRDLTNQYISLSYQDVVQRYTQGTASYFLDGLGNVIVWLPTSSLGQQVITADQPVPFAVSASYALNGGSGGGSSTSSSWASHSFMSDTASYALSSTFCDTASVSFESTFADTASLAFYSNYAGSSSYAFTASVALNIPQTASNALTASNLVGWNFTNTSSNVNILSSNVPVVEIATGSYNAAFFDYVALSESNCRAGIVFGSWVGALINYTEVSNVDVGDTSKVTMSLALNGGNVQLLANVTDTTPWQIKALGRYL